MAQGQRHAGSHADRQGGGGAGRERHGTKKNKDMNRTLLSSILIATMAVAGCTDLDETLYDKVSTDDYGKTDEEVNTIVGGAYATLRGYGASTEEGNGVNCYPTCEYVLFLNEIASDEGVIPTRGTDWYDGGRYLHIQRHTWDAANVMITSGWRYAFTGVTKVNAIIYQIENSELSGEAKAKVEAELRGLRAYYYWLLIDQYGNVPIVTDFTQTELPANSQRADVFAFIEKELTEAIPLLPEGVQYGRFTQNVANTLLARLYLNAEVYTGTARWQDCLDACDKVAGYSLENDLSTSFLTKNEVSREIIFAIPYDHTQGTVGNYLSSMSYHYNQKYAFDPNGVWQWSANGICAQPGVYSSFEEGDLRRDKSLLVGQQYSAKDGAAVNMDNGEPLNYTEEISNVENARQNEGARLNKYQVQPNDQWERDNDWVLMRYAEVIMMQAEANFRLGNNAPALAHLNAIRQRAGLGALQDISLEAIDSEWLHEFTFEGLRRTVNIRFGTFFQPWWEKGADPADKHTGIYPVPQVELDKNPNLRQNPGY